MKQLASLLLLATLAAPAAAVPGGELDTLVIGDYRCGFPGDATGPVSKPAPAEDFAVISSSNYRANGTAGSYLRTGNLVTFTSGPKYGQRFQRVSRGFLRQLDNGGAVTSLRCVLSSTAHH